MARTITMTNFATNVVNYIEKHASVLSKEYVSDVIVQYTLKTNFGELSVSVYNRPSEIYTVFSRFSDKDSAKERFNCNPHSGKYNFHLSQEGKNKAQSDKIAFSDFCHWIDPIIL